MTALVINDLPVGKDLDRAAMASITGGHGRGCGKRKGHRRPDFFNSGNIVRIGDVTDSVVIIGDNNTVG